MKRIIDLIEAELEKLAKENDYLRWENEELKKELKKAKEKEDGRV